MSYFAVGADGMILRLGPQQDGAGQPWAKGLFLESHEGTKTLNGIARMPIPGRTPQTIGEQFERFLAVGDDGVAPSRSCKWAFTSADWSRGPTGDGRNLNAVAIAPDARSAWAVGDEGTILRTTDGGQNWGKQASHIARHLRAVVAVNTDRAWAVGDEGELHRTDDGGQTWPRTTVAGLTKHLRAICAGQGLRVAVDDDGTLVYRHKGVWGHAEITGKHLRAVAISPGGLIIAVGDDGWIGSRKPGAFGGNETSRWTRRDDVTSKHLRAVIARDDRNWAIVGDRVLLTTDDGGASWRQRQAPSGLRAVC